MPHQITLKFTLKKGFPRRFYIDEENPNFHTINKFIEFGGKESGLVNLLTNRKEYVKSNWCFRYLIGEELFPPKIILLLADYLRKIGANIISPKEIMHPKHFSTRNNGNVIKVNVFYLADKYNIPLVELTDHAKLNKGYLPNAKSQDSVMKAETLLKLYKTFKAIGVPLTCALDLIYFPSWGETVSSYYSFQRITKRTELQAPPRGFRKRFIA